MVAFLATTLFLFSVARAETDPIEGLISREQAAYQAWLADSEDLPSALLPGDGQSADLFLPGQSSDVSLVCHEPDINSLLEASGGDSGRSEVTLNLSLARVRAMFGESCLIRPGDRLAVVGRGRVDERTVSEVLLRRLPPSCPGEKAYALSVRFAVPPDEEPLFYSTDRELAVGSFPFSPAERLSPASLPEGFATLLGKAVPYPEDFTLQSWEVPGVSSVTVILMNRSTLTTDDDGLAVSVLLVTDGSTIEPLWTERVDLRHGTGSIRVVGVSDFDRDGLPEIIVDGVNRRCSYRTGFTPTPEGWRPLALPFRRCGC